MLSGPYVSIFQQFIGIRLGLAFDARINIENKKKKCR